MASPSSWFLPDGASVAVTPVSGGFTAQLYGADGAAEGALFSAVQADLGDYVFEGLTPLATGGYVLSYLHEGALVPGASLLCATFAGDGHLLNTAQVSIPSAEGGDFPVSAGQVYALPDGGFVEAWTDAAPYASGPSGQATVREFDAQGLPVEAAQLLGPLASGHVGVKVNGDGTYVVSWQSYMGLQQRTFTEQGAPVSAAQGAASPALIPQWSVTLTGSAGWTGAAMLANHTLAIVGAKDGGYGSHVAAEQTYDASGAQTASASLLGYTGPGQTLTPQITALGQGGYYQVNYAGSTDYEIYNGADQRVFVHNAWSNANSHFTALANGGYVVTDFPDHVMGLYDSANHNVGWIGLSGAAPAGIQARADGGFDFLYSDHVQGYNAQGAQDANLALGAAGSGYATATAALGGGAVAEVWLSPDHGQYGFATSIRFQTFAPGGASAAIEIAQDLDPWHTAFQIQAHADGSAAILWSQGGAVFGAEYAHGAVGPVYTAMAGALATTDVIQLPGDRVGLAYIENGDVFARIFDPSTGAVQRADLGASNGDLGGVHLLATAAGGMAVSWHGTSGVLGATLGASGQVGAAMSLPGDLLGVDSSGHAVILHDQGGMPVLQTYAANDGLFWAA